MSFFPTITETIALFYNNVYINSLKNLQADTYYLLSFNTAKIRELLKKWGANRDININEMLSSIMYFFHQLQIPATPMNVTLFIGVLFRDKNKKNIKNEAYLIENYLETMLEKLRDDRPDVEFDFREKESFLSHIALEMIKKNKFELLREEFDKECSDYFNYLDEDPPSDHFYDDFFKNGIFEKNNGKIRFKFKFWFNFFVAKAMQNSSENKNYVLSLPNYLKYATALAYKAGLDRNDLELLNTINERLEAFMKEISRDFSDKNFSEYEIEGALIEYSKEIEGEIKEKNKPEEIDRLRDEKYLDYEKENAEVDSEEDGSQKNVFELITLYSDVIRNTREISADQKRIHLRNSVGLYINLMWESLELFKYFIEQQDKTDIKRLILKSESSIKNNIDINEKELNKINEKLKEFIFIGIPISIILFMSDHLAINKLARTISNLIAVEKNINTRLFYCLLLLKIKFDKAIMLLKEFVKTSNSYIMDRIIFDYLVIFCLETELEEAQFSLLSEIFNMIREKYSKKVDKKYKEIYIKDTFISDIQTKINLIKFKKSR